MLSPAKLSNSSGSAPGSGAPGYGAPGYGRTWAHLIAFSGCRLKFFFRVTPSCVYIAESTKTHAPAPFSLASSTARRSAVRCRAVSCPARGAVLCRAVPCFAECSLSCIPDDNASKHTELARASMYVLEHFIQLQHAVFIFHCCLFFGLQQISSSGTYAATNSSTTVCIIRVCMSLNREHSTAQRNLPCTRQQTKYVPIRVRI